MDGKIGFSDIGGIYIGKNISSNNHRYYAVSVLLALGDPFAISSDGLKETKTRVAIIQKNVDYSLHTSGEDFTAFIHVAPWSDAGALLHHHRPVQLPDIIIFEKYIQKIKDWSGSTGPNPETVRGLLHALTDIKEIVAPVPALMDDRVRKGIEAINGHEFPEQLKTRDIAREVCLSEGRFAHLFKEETGMTFRQFVLHGKLVRSIYGLYLENNLTEAAFAGGFSDQPHFTRAFKNAFGLRPSDVNK